MIKQGSIWYDRKNKRLLLVTEDINSIKLYTDEITVVNLNTGKITAELKYDFSKDYENIAPNFKGYENLLTEEIENDS